MKLSLLKLSLLQASLLFSIPYAYNLVAAETQPLIADSEVDLHQPDQYFLRTKRSKRGMITYKEYTPATKRRRQLRKQKGLVVDAAVQQQIFPGRGTSPETTRKQRKESCIIA